MNKMRQFLLLYLNIVSVVTLTAQDISKQEYRQRREQLRKLLPDNSLAVFFSAPIKNRSNDTDYHYHPDPNMVYLSGWEEPHAVLLVFKNLQQDSEGIFSEVLYVRDRDPYEELWNGKVMGVDRAQDWGLDRVQNRIDFIESPLNYDAFDSVLIYEFQNDVRDRPRDNYDLYALQKHFRTQLNYPAQFNPIRYGLYQKIRQLTPRNIKPLQSEIRRMVVIESGLQDDDLLQEFLSLTDTSSSEELKIQSDFLLQNIHFDVDQLPKLMGQLREIKSKTEIRLLKKAAQISVMGQIEVMKAIHPEMSEREIQGIHEFVYKKYGAADVGYPSIVGAGGNGCVLHYNHNEMEKVDNQMVLMDVGAEYKGYTADVTRTLPANGTFTQAQKELYSVVFKAQEAGIAAAQVGVSFTRITQAVYDEITRGLQALGLITQANEMSKYLPHGVAHHIGLDVHDPGEYTFLKPNMVITVEPGIYVPEGSPCDRKWWNIGIRIEDDILITNEGPINLSDGAPRTWEAIEQQMRSDSVLNSWILPPLED